MMWSCVVHGILTFTIYDIPGYYLHIGLAHIVSKWFWALSIAEVLISVLFLIKLIQFCHVLSRNGYPQFEKPYDPENSPTGLSSWGSRHHFNFQSCTSCWWKKSCAAWDVYIRHIEPYSVNSGISYLSTDAGVLPSTESHHQDERLRHRRSTGHHFLHLSSRSSPTVQSFGVFCFIFDEHAGMSMIRFYFDLFCTKHVPWRTTALFQRWINHVSMCRQVVSRPTTMKTTSISWKANFNLRPWTRGFGSLDRLCVFRCCVCRHWCNWPPKPTA